MRNLKVVEGGREEDLVTTLLRAIDLAESSRSGTTVYLLKMALLNEGILLATDLSRKETGSGVREEYSASSRPNFFDAEGIMDCQLPSPHSARRAGARPR
jgi:hypothetical protein